MAIVKTYLGGDISALESFLHETGLFAHITRSNNVITCKNENNETVLTISKDEAYVWTFTVLFSDNRTWEKSYSNHGLNYGYNCGNGAFLVLNSASLDNQYSVAITRNNKNQLTFVFPESYISRNQVYCFTRTDPAPINYYQVHTAVSGQTVLTPFLTNAADGDVSFTPNAYYMIFGAYVGRGYAKFLMNGKRYLTDGQWVLLDENAAS